MTSMTMRSRGRGGCCTARSKTSDTKGTHEGACRILETTNSKHNEKLHCFGIQIYGLQVGDVSKGVIYARLGAKLDGNYIRRPLSLLNHKNYPFQTGADLQRSFFQVVFLDSKSSSL